MSFKILLSPSETDSGGGETDTGGDPDGVQVRIDAAVEKATQGLLKKNDELKGEKQNARRQLDSLVESIESLGGAEGLKSLRDMRARLENDEIGRLVAEGKHEAKDLDNEQLDDFLDLVRKYLNGIKEATLAAIEHVPPSLQLTGKPKQG